MLQGLHCRSNTEALQEAKYVAGNRMVLDSLNHMFYEAREKGDREEMGAYPGGFQSLL